MRRVILIIFMILILLVTWVQGEKIGVLSEVLKPASMEVSSTRFPALKEITITGNKRETSAPMG